MELIADSLDVDLRWLYGQNVPMEHTSQNVYGVGYWNLMRPFPQNWRVLNALYRIRTV